MVNGKTLKITNFGGMRRRGLRWRLWEGGNGWGSGNSKHFFFEKTQTSRKVRKGLEYSLQELRKYSYVYPRMGILLDLTFTPWPRPLSVLCYWEVGEPRKHVALGTKALDSLKNQGADSVKFCRDYIDKEKTPSILQSLMLASAI